MNGESIWLIFLGHVYQAISVSKVHCVFRKYTCVTTSVAAVVVSPSVVWTNIPHTIYSDIKTARTEAGRVRLKLFLVLKILFSTENAI